MTNPNAATEPSKQIKTSNGLSMSNALMMPTAPVAKQPKTAQSNALVLRELLSVVSLLSGVCICVDINYMMIELPTTKVEPRRTQ
jgi:hypothetical protein